MDLWLHWDRLKQGSDSTISNFSVQETGERICYLLEDQWQPTKVPAETRIPPGVYEIKLRKDSPKFSHYYERWDWFEGMPWLVDVEGDGVGFEIMNFEYVYLHPGEDDDDSAGCGITGLEYLETKDGNFVIKPGTSRKAFERACRGFIYPAFREGKKIFVQVSDSQLWE